MRTVTYPTTTSTTGKRLQGKKKTEKTNVIHNEVKALRDYLKQKHKKEGTKKYNFKKDYAITTLHRKGAWVNPNKISILKKPRIRLPNKLEWLNKETLSATNQQRIQLERLLANPSQDIKLRTEKHATKDLKLYTPRVFRNEGGNLMSSIAGAGCNKFHEFRQIRRNDRDREKHFTYLRNKEEREKLLKEKVQNDKDDFHKKLSKNQKIRNHRLVKIKSRKMQLKAKIKTQRLKNKLERVVTDPKPKATTPAIVQVQSDNSSDDYDSDEDEGLPPKQLRQKILGN